MGLAMTYAQSAQATHTQRAEGNVQTVQIRTSLTLTIELVVPVDQATTLIKIVLDVLHALLDDIPA